MGIQLDKGEHWSNQAACKKLSMQESDKIFFVGKGGKRTKAEKVCSGCPVQRRCLLEAITYDLEGFWAGTTQKERRQMKVFQGNVQPINEVVESLVEVPESRPKIYKRTRSKTKPVEVEPTEQDLEAIQVSRLDVVTV